MSIADAGGRLHGLQLQVTERSRVLAGGAAEAAGSPLRPRPASPQRRCDVHWAPLPPPSSQCTELDAARNAARFGDRVPPEPAETAPEDAPAKAPGPWYLEFVALGTAGEGLPVAVSRDSDAPRRVRLRPRTGPHQMVLVRVAPRLFSLKPGACGRDRASPAWGAAPEPAATDAGDEYALLSGLVWTTPSCRPLGACEATLALLAAATSSSPPHHAAAAMPLASPAPTTRFAATPSRSPPLSAPRRATPCAAATPATTRRATPAQQRGSPAAAEGTPGRGSPSPRGWAIGWAPASARRGASPGEALPFPSPARLMAALGGSPAAALWGRALTRAAAADAARAAEEARAAEAAAAAAAAQRNAAATAAMPAPAAAPAAAERSDEQPGSGGKRRSPRAEARIVAASRGTDKASRRLRAASRLMLAPPREARLSPASAAAARLATRARALGLRLLTSAPGGTPPSRRRVAPRPAPAWPPGGAPPPPPEHVSPSALPAAEAVPPQRSPALFCAAAVSPPAQAAPPAMPQIFTFAAGSSKAASARPTRQRSFGADVTNSAAPSLSPTLLAMR